MMKLLFSFLLLLSSYTVFAQEYVKVFDDKDMDYYAYSQCEIDEQGNYLLWTKQVIKPERFNKSPLCFGIGDFLGSSDISSDIMTR